MPPNNKKGPTGSKYQKPGGGSVNISEKSSRKTLQHSDENVKQESQILNLVSYLFFWSEKYDDNLQKVWNKLPTVVGSVVASIAVFIFGITARGTYLHMHID